MQERKLGDIIRALREARGLTQQQLAILMGVAPQRIGNLEQGLRDDPRWSTVQTLADALGVPTQDLRTFTRKTKTRKSGTKSL